VIVGQLESHGFDISRLDALIKLELEFKNAKANMSAFGAGRWFKMLDETMESWEPWHLKYKLEGDLKNKYDETLQFCRLVLQPWTNYWET
jgi:hypothetical protein